MSLKSSLHNNNMNSNNINYIDTHCHLDLYKDPEDIIRKAKADHTHIVAVTNLPSVYKREVKMYKAENVTLSLGLHPQLVKEYSHEIDLFLELLPDTKFLGEVGLDYQETDETLKKKQKSIFEKILSECARYKNKILTVHSRRSSEDVVSMIGADFPGTIILHWYSGSISTLNKALALGCLFSINPAMTLSKSGQSIINAVPIERILTETDGPFTNTNKKISDPSDVIFVINYLAKLHGKTSDEVREKVKTNLLECLKK